MDGTRRRATISHSSTVQELRPAIQIHKDRMIPVLELVNQEGNANDSVINATIDTRPSPVIDVTLLPRPPLCTEDVPPPPPLKRPDDISFFSTAKDERTLEHVERNQEKILMEIATQIDVAQ